MADPSEEVGIDGWATQLRKGVLELCILNLLAGSELYGYDLVKQLAGIQGLIVTEGTIYPLLSRLRRSGLLGTRLEESPSGPARKYYRLTPEGWKVRNVMNRRWDELVEGIGNLRKKPEANHG